jgi:hypothetical protein
MLLAKPNAVGLGCEAKQSAVGVECVRPPGIEKFEAAFLTAIDEPFADAAVDAKYEVQGVGAEACNLNDLCDPSGIEAPQACSRPYVLKVEHGDLSIRRIHRRLPVGKQRGTSHQPRRGSEKVIRSSREAIVRPV